MSVITVELEIQTGCHQPSIADWSKALLEQEISYADNTYACYTTCGEQTTLHIDISVKLCTLQI
jgi:hypothetical protein